MNYDFDDIMLPGKNTRAFTFIEVVTALTIVSVITFGVLVVINRSVASMIENQARIQAFELARENMENLLASDSVSDMVEFGVHEFNEDIEWEKVVESFTEPVGSNMWIRAVCTATYFDKNDEKQTIRLEHWLTGLSKTQEKQILDQQKREAEFLENMEGNPFGDDPDGLMQYSKALSSMGDYAGAAEALNQLIEEYPESPLVDLAVDNMIGNAWAALSDGDIETAGPIIEILNDLDPENKNVQKLPKPQVLTPGFVIPGAMIPSKYKPDAPKLDKPSTEPKPGRDDKPLDTKNPSDPDNPSEQPNENSDRPPRPPEYDRWTPEQQRLWDDIMDRFYGK